MITRSILLDYISQTLEPNRFNDYCPNGLQIQGGDDIGMIVSGVTACEALIDAAIDLNADALLVHHGYFWRGEAQTLTGIKQRRIKKLLQHDINLLAYHLPLDAHLQFGNNVQLAKRLGFIVNASIPGTGQPETGLMGKLPRPETLSNVAKTVALQLNREPLIIQGNDNLIETVGWCTGAAQGYIEQAAESNLDLYISGEVSEQTMHLAKELGINYIAAGHHATERYGVMALGEQIAKQFSVQHHFIDINNPV